MLSIPKTIREEVVEVARRRIQEEDQDCMIVLLGPRGTGKSSVAMQLQYEFSKSFSLDRIGWEFDEHRRKLLIDLPLGSGYHGDEIRFHRMDFRTNLGVEVDKFFTELRPFNHFTTWSSVRMHKILGTFLEFGHFLFYFYDVGKCVVLKRNDNIVQGNAFGLGKDIEKINNARTFKKYFVTPSKQLKVLVGKFAFPRYTEHVNPEFYAKYKILRLESTRKRYGGEKELEKLNGQQVYDLIRKGREVGVTHAQLAHIVNRKESSIGGIVTKLRKRGVLS